MYKLYRHCRHVKGAIALMLQEVGAISTLAPKEIASDPKRVVQQDFPGRLSKVGLYSHVSSEVVDEIL